MSSLHSHETSKATNLWSYADIFQATVVSCDPGTGVIIVAPDGENNHNQLQAISLSSTFSAAMGFVETMLPGVGTRVLCSGRNSKKTFILGCIPAPEMQGKLSSPTLPNKAILGALEPVLNPVHSSGYNDQFTKSTILNNNLPSDAMAGEKVISNEFGIMMGLFKLMGTLKASELAQIQVHFLDDLVRIISHNFQHYTGLSQLNIFQDGAGLHLELGATHIPGESLGKPDNTEGVGILPITQDDTPNQFYKLSDDQLNMLERMKLFVGQLGQFVNLLIVNPSQEQHALNGSTPNTPDTGLLQIKASLDGTLVVRSASGIYLEKTNWIRVPQRILTPEDPTGDSVEDTEYPEQPAYTFDNTYSYRSTAFLYYLQLRDYLAYINEELGYTNFNAQTKDFYTNKDITKDKLSSTTYIDQETGISYTMTKSWISLMANGGISWADAWGSCISMEGGNIYLQPAKDLIVQPNRNLVAKVGGNIAIAAQKEIDLSSTIGGMRIKTKNAQYLYSSNGGIILHTDGDNFENGTVLYGNKPGSMIYDAAGIIMYAPNSGVNSYAQQIYDYSLITSVYQSAQSLLLDAQSTELFANNDVLLCSKVIQLLSSSSTTSYSQGSNLMLGMLGTTIGIKNQTFGYASVMGKPAYPVQGEMDPTNNLNVQYFNQLNAEVTQFINYDVTKQLESFKDLTNFTKIKFQFPPTELYGLDTHTDVIPQTLSQQTDSLSGMYGLQPWVEWSDPTSNSYPYPGAGFVNCLATVPVKNIDTNTGTAIGISNKAESLSATSVMAALQNIFTQYKSM